MASSDIQISNYALSLLGEQVIRSFDEDNSRSRLCKKIYELAVGIVLGRVDWTFARWRAELKQSLDTGLYIEEGFAAYLLPADCVVPLSINKILPRLSWEVYGTYIVTKELTPLVLTYTRKITNSAEFTTPFESAVARLMATCLAGPLTGASVNEVNALNNLYEFELTVSSTTDSNIGDDLPDPDEDPNRDTFNTGEDHFTVSQYLRS